VHVLGGLNALQTANGWPALTWTTLLETGPPPPAFGSVVTADHLAALRARIDTALGDLGIPAVPYPDTPVRPGLTVIKAAHITAAQQRMR
jgi:hypothetical protein